MLAPPLLPKPTRTNNSDLSERGKLTRATTSANDVNDNFEVTMSKEQLSKELVNFQKKDIHEINSGLNKIFQHLNMTEQDEEI